LDKNVYVGLKSGGWVMGLVADMNFAARIAKTAKQYGMNIHNCDRAEILISHAGKNRPLFVVLDWDGCESEAFKVLKEFAANADLRKVPVVGCLSSSKAGLKPVAEKAGCDRVYFKTEFFRVLSELFIRYTQ
jgi:DNA-binding response OmpR family regulator